MRKTGQAIRQMSVDELTEKVAIVYYEKQVNSRGDIVKISEVVRCMVWAKVFPITGRINDATPERINTVTYRITIRYREDIEAEDEIMWRGRRLKITSPPVDLESYHKWTQLECTEVLKDGKT